MTELAPDVVDAAEPPSPELEELIEALRGATPDAAELASIKTAVVASTVAASGTAAASPLLGGWSLKAMLSVVLGSTLVAGVLLTTRATPSPRSTAVHATAADPGPSTRSTDLPSSREASARAPVGGPSAVAVAAPDADEHADPAPPPAASRGATSNPMPTTASSTAHQSPVRSGDLVRPKGPALEVGAFSRAPDHRAVGPIARLAQALPTADVPPRPPSAAQRPPSEALANGLRLYARAEHEAAAGALLPVLEGRAQEDAPNFQHAQFVYAKALFHLGLYHSATVAFEEIAREGPTHAYFDATLPWLAQLADHLPRPDRLIDAIGAYSDDRIARLDTPETRDRYDQLAYLLGRHRYDEGRLDEALGLFSRVRRGSDHYVPARFFMGVTQVRRRRARPAIAAFRTVIDTIEDGDEGDLDDSDRLLDLAWLSLARVYYSASLTHDEREALIANGRVLGSALDAWTRIPEGSEHWLDSMFEQSWALFLAEEHDRALGRIHALLSPYFEHEFFPEALVLKAVIYFSHCHLDAAERVVYEFHHRYDAIHRELAATLRAQRDNAAAFEFLGAVHGRRDGLSPRVADVVRKVLSDRELARHADQVGSIQAEERAAWRRLGDPSVSPLSARLGQELAVEQALAIDAAGERVKLRLERLVEQLQERANEIDAVQLEIITERRRNPNAHRDTGEPVRIVADQEHQIWPFDGEYWRDELPYYRVYVPNRCGR